MASLWDPDKNYIYVTREPDVSTGGAIYEVSPDGLTRTLIMTDVNLSGSFQPTQDGSVTYGDIVVDDQGRMFALVGEPSGQTNDPSRPLTMVEIINDDVAGQSVELVTVTGTGNIFAVNEALTSMALHPDGSIYFTKQTGSSNTTENHSLYRLVEQPDGSWTNALIETRSDDRVSEIEFISHSQYLMIGAPDKADNRDMFLVTIDPATGAQTGRVKVFDFQSGFASPVGFTLSQDANGDLTMTAYDEGTFARSYQTMVLTFNNTVVDPATGAVSWDSITAAAEQDGPSGNSNAWNVAGTTGGTWEFICFARGTMIDTDQGRVAVEDLERGMLVRTMDHGLQPIRWTGSRKLAASFEAASVVFKTGAVGNDRELRVSPAHRMLIGGWQAQLLFGTDELLVAAIDLVNGDTVYRAEAGEVEYFHIMFDRHEIIFAEGSASESFHVRDASFNRATEAQRAEILAIFPELQTGPERFGESARPVLSSYEAKLLV